ncbi:calcium-transporting ATPase 12, plasma membrane-type-like [Henckelia pumila]|uniref:calcium-transporting ATPase 12, plasma membrane-type-like n=1 Tax=Henckelia pumila TaxID=405737 RepID=UPI003C6E4C9B
METLQGIMNRLPSFMVVDMPPDTSSPFNVDKEKLIQLASNKDRDILLELGGVDGIILSLKTHAIYGIRGDAADLARRINFFESSYCVDRGVVLRYLRAAVDRFVDLLFLFLCICCEYLVIVGIKKYGIVDGWKDGVYSLAFVLLVSVISSMIGQGVEDYSDKSIKGSELVIVLRNGLKQLIPVSNILVGDIALLKKGDEIPADGLFLEAYGDDQSLKLYCSGELVEISHSEPFLSSGAEVVEGRAKMMVIRAAKGTNFHRGYEETKLGAQMNYLIRLLEGMKWAVAMISLVISLSVYFNGTAKNDEGYVLFERGTTSALEVSYMIVYYMVTASVIFLAMDTSNFSWALKVCFAHAVNEMAGCDVVVRSLSSWEEIGLGVANVHVIDEFNASNQSIASTFLFVPQITENKKASACVAANVLELIQQGVGLNMTGVSNHAQRRCKLKFSGSPRERAFTSQAALESGKDWEKLMNECEIIRVEALENESRVILVKRGDSFLEHRRGPAETTLSLCSGYYDHLGILRSLDEYARGLLKQRLQSMNSDGRAQVISLAYRQVVPDQEYLTDDSHSEAEEDGYHLLGFVVLMELNQDWILGFEQNSRNEDLDNGAEFEETEMNQISDDVISEKGALSEEQEKNQSGEEKNESKEDKECSKEVVSVSGSDGSITLEHIPHATESVPVEEDVTTLSEAKISTISMGIEGDETSTSDIVILDGNITTLSLILMWTKCMLLNTQAFTQFQLTVMITSITNAFVVSMGPLKTQGVNRALACELVQLIWVNAVMGLIGTVTFGRRRPQHSITLLQEPPNEERIWFITGYMWRNIMTQSAYQITVASMLQYKGTIFGFTDREAETATFVAPILLQVLNMISARKVEEKNIFSGIQPRFIWLIAALMFAPFVWVEILARIVNLGRLEVTQWGICIAMALVSWPVGFAAKFMPVGFFFVPLNAVAAAIMAVIERLKELGNWIKLIYSKPAFL